MTTRIGLIVAVLVVAAVALWHPAPRATFQTVAASSLGAKPGDGRSSTGRRPRNHADSIDAVVYVVGAVRRPGLYHVHADDRAADAIARAGGLSAAADPAGVNLAAHAADGDEIYVPVAGEAVARRPNAYPSRRRRGRSRAAPSENVASIAPGSIDVNAAGADALAHVPGIGRSIAARIVEMRERDGAFASLDELLDVAGMSQTRLERARPFLQPP